MKSQVTYLLEVAERVLADCVARCSAKSPDLRDLETIRSRVKSGGLSFLTITLPDFCAEFERSLALGRIEASAFPYFRKTGAIPSFLKGMLSNIFDVGTGDLLDVPHSTKIETVFAIRQFCLFAKKIRLPCAPARERKAVEDFKRVEREFSEFNLDPTDFDLFDQVCCGLWDTMWLDFNPADMVPRHGPGATADRKHGNSKFVIEQWYESVEQYFPFVGTGYTVSSYDSKEFHSVQIQPLEAERVSKLVLVPKTLKAPRSIAIEPSSLQYIQQAIRSYLYEKIESSLLTAGQINFADQTVNGSKALAGSLDGSIATIDLSEASDRVPLDLSLRMFDGNPDLRDAIGACRSTYTKAPDGTLIGPLRKFASMGNALCFPVESAYFYTLCVAARLRLHELPASPINIYNVGRAIFVYGDDLIVPAEEAEAILALLRRFNCKINDRKTFWKGNFRESCGVDAYLGESVTPVYLREPPPESRADASSLISWTAAANQFYWLGLWSTAEYLYSTVERFLGTLPYLSSSSAGLGRQSGTRRRSASRWNINTHQPEVRAWVPTSVKTSDPLTGYPALMKCLLILERRSGDVERGFNAFAKNPDSDHLDRSPRYGAVTLQLRWVPTHQ